MDTVSPEKEIRLDGAKLFRGHEDDYEERESILEYLSSHGENIVLSPGSYTDHTGKSVNVRKYVKADGFFSWNGLLQHYVEKYNTRLPKEVEDHILDQLKTS
ncbi:MAG: hypothetical protein FWE41_08890 [Coriobacteriia bacterium]|nr:hypothetical protein [Coriobacteriia bacterium]MCL2537516.1 hypothetical protein [Coriobacteriia bacterium]